MMATSGVQRLHKEPRMDGTNFLVSCTEPHLLNRPMTTLWKIYDIARDFLQERWVYNNIEAPVLDLSGKVLLVTGANAGLGKESVRQLALMKPAKIIMAVRNVEKGEKARREIMDMTGFQHLQVEHLDLCSLGSVTKLSEKLLKTEERLDVLMCNAGLGSLAEVAKKTEDGFDEMFQGNNLGHFLLAQNLMPLLKSSSSDEPARIIFLSSLAAKFAFSFDINSYSNTERTPSLNYYNTSKLMAGLMAKGLADRLGRVPVVHSCHPGTVATEFADKYPTFMKDYIFPTIYTFFGRSLYSGAATQVYLASAPECAKTTGKYWSNMRITQPNVIIENSQLCRQFVELCDELIAKYKV